MQKAAYAYLATQVNTTDKGDLLLLLYEGAIKFLKQAKAKIEERDYAQKGILISRALDVIAELDGSLNAEKGGELAQNLHNLYFYCNTRLLQANLRMNVTQIDEVIRILEGLKEAFTQVANAGHAGKPAAAPAGAPPLFSLGRPASGPAPAAHVVAATAPAYKPAAPAPAATPAAATRPAATPVAAPRPAASPVAAPRPAEPAAAPQAPPGSQADPGLARVKALHRAYGRYGAS